MRCSDCAAAMDEGAVAPMHSHDLYAWLLLVCSVQVEPACSLVSL